MTSSKKIWAGRGILLALIVAIAGVLAYLYATDNASKKDLIASTQVEQAQLLSKQDSFKLVKDAYETYLTTYKEDKPNLDAVSTFKKSMTEDGARVLGESVKGQDSILCTTSKPKALSYTTPTQSRDIAIITVVATMEKGTAQAIVTVDASEGRIASVVCK